MCVSYVDGVVDVLLVTVENVQTDGESLDAALRPAVATGRLFLLFLFLLLFFLLLLLLLLVATLLIAILLLFLLKLKKFNLVKRIYL